MKTIQNFVLLILLFSAKTIFSQDVIALEGNQESIITNSSPTENPETLASIPSDKAPEEVKLDNLATLQPQEAETQGIVVNSPDNQENNEEIPTVVPEEQGLGTVDSDPAAETPIETTNEEPPKATLSETEPEVPGNTSEQIPSDTTENVQPIESTLSPEIEEVTEDQVSGTNETEVPSETSIGTLETESTKTEAETEAVVQESSNTEASSNTDTSETELSQTEKPETEPVAEEVNTTEPPANPEASVTESSKTEEAETESVVEEAENTEAPAINNESTDATIEAEPTSSEPELNVETSSISSNPSTEATENPTETSSNPSEVPSTTITPCTEIGNFANPTNCRRYLSCTGNTSNLISEDCECPEKTAFSPILGRCTRDLSPCLDEEPVCLRTSSIPNPNGEKSSYFWCVPSLLGGFHKYQIQCSENEVFIPLIGRCWIATPQMGGGLGFGLINLVPSDRDIVRAEWKLLRKEIKEKIKAEKLQKKLEEKAKARAEKLAAKELKKQKGVVRKVDDENDGEEEDDE
ncbi:salivary glue protein Sgs-3 [Episyrphus balteatus]|uniref:salivary glue protein Sgs-3 n=1 Tax=Episyrphus balteatus TaxID=286459 RepID=UPI002486ADB7|nr:salivary glue protein Sgs-3 [Episyrphus balteatus]